MTTTQHQVTIRFTTDDAEDTDALPATLEDALTELCADLEIVGGAVNVTTRYETRRHGFGQATVPAVDEGDPDA